MAKLRIVTYPQKVLKRRATKVTPTPEIAKLIPLMIDAMYDNEGIGLAAPQIGVPKRIIIVEGSHEPRKTVRDEKTKEKPFDSGQGKPLAFLNPVITEKSTDQETEEEGCLSLPGVFVPVKRSTKIKLTCQTSDGKEVHVEAAGLIARIFQHEVDHLNGKLIINHVSPYKRFKLRKQLKEIAQHAK